MEILNTHIQNPGPALGCSAEDSNSPRRLGGGRRWRRPAGAWGGGRWTEGGGGRRQAPRTAAALCGCAGAAGGLECRAPAASEPARAPSGARCTVSQVLFRPRSVVRLASPLDGGETMGIKIYNQSRLGINWIRVTSLSTCVHGKQLTNVF